jgi:CTP synthase
VLKPGSKAHKAYGTERIAERHRHRYEFNPEFREKLENEAGLVISGTSPDGRLVEVVEVADHPWFVACQFHPEFASTPFRPSPLFVDFIAATRKYSSKREVDSESSG